MQHNTTLLTILILLISIFCYSQSQITEINGRKIEILEDGTWRFIVEEPKEREELTCKDVISMNYDPQDYSLKFNTEPIISDQLTFYWKLDKPSGLTLFLRASGFNCTKNGEEYIFYFENDIIVLENVVSDNCLGYAGFKPTGGDLISFKNRKLKRIKIPLKDKKVTKTLDPKISKDFLFQCGCISKVELN